MLQLPDNSAFLPILPKEVYCPLPHPQRAASQPHRLTQAFFNFDHSNHVLVGEAPSAGGSEPGSPGSGTDIGGRSVREFESGTPTHRRMFSLDLLK